MTLHLSLELQRAIQAAQAELEVVDPSTNQHYVIVAKERWLEKAGADQQCQPDGGAPNSEPSAIWTEEKNRRRAELVDRQVAGTLTNEESDELNRLQRQMRAYRDQVAPLPLEDVRQLHAELMEKSHKAQAPKA